MTAIRSRVAACAFALSFAACSGDMEPAAQTDEQAPRGAELVVGTSIDEWTLLSIPMAGGPAELRSLRDLSDVLWTGQSDIPQVAEAHALLGGQTVLRSAGGSVLSYQRVSDEVLRLDSIAPESKWVGFGSSGLYLDQAAGDVLHVSGAGTWRYSVSDPIVWASPLDDETVALLVSSGSGTRLLVLQRAEESPAEESGAALNAPGVALAWGRRLALVSADGGALKFVTIAPVTEVASVDLPDSPTAIAASPSSHEVYLAVKDPPRIVAINRFSLSQRELARFDREILEIRPSLLGESLLAWDGQQAWHLGVSGDRPEPVEGAWRTDLPLGLPGGRILAALDDELVVFSRGGTTRSARLGLPADHFWVPVYGDAAGQVILADEIRGERVVDSTRVDAEGRAAAAVPPAPAAFDDRTGAELEPEDVAAEAVSSDPPGFYAIVGSARQRGGIQELADGLASAGYPTRVQRVPDDAGDTWYRGLVGPYRTRPEADAAARQLTRERRLQTWVTEIGADGLR